MEQSYCCSSPAGSAQTLPASHALRKAYLQSKLIRRVQETMGVWFDNNNNSNNDDNDQEDALSNIESEWVHVALDQVHAA